MWGGQRAGRSVWHEGEGWRGGGGAENAIPVALASTWLFGGQCTQYRNESKAAQ
jgi:hypothetical protein